jgi:hypothetical protein
MSLLGALAALMLTPVVQLDMPRPDPSEAANGDFRGKMLIVSDVEKFWAIWEKPEPPSIETTGEIRRGGRVTAMVVFAVCKAAADGKCNVSATFSMIGPDGKAYGEKASGKAWTEAPAPGFNLLASLAAMTFQLDPPDKLGRYRMIATLTDEVAGKSFTVSDTVTAVAN